MLAALFRFLRNAFAVLVNGEPGGRLAAIFAQWYAFSAAVRHGLPVVASRETSRRRATGPERFEEDGVIGVELDSGRAELGLPSSPKPEHWARRRELQRFLSLVANVEPCSLGAALHLLDCPKPLERAGLAELAFNRRRDSPAALVVVPDPHFVRSEAYQARRGELDRAKVPWHERKPSAFWRGSSTGGSLREGQDPRQNPRVKLCLRASELASLLDARITRAVQCDPANEAELAGLGVMGDYAEPRAHLAYRYLISIDGWAGEWDGLYWKLYSGSVVLRVESAWTQWYTDLLEPFRHYVPVSGDLSDLEARITWCKEHDDECRAMAERARELLAREVTFPRAVAYTARALRALAEPSTA